MKTTIVTVVKPFIYPVKNKPQWITPESHPTFKLPAHAANELVRQGKASTTESHPTFKLPAHAANELVRQGKASTTESDQDK